MTDETYQMMEEATQAQLVRVTNLDATTKEGKEALDKTIRLVELLVNKDRDDMEYYDKQERRRAEEERNKAQNEIERKKQSLTWDRVSLEMAKVVVPAAMSLTALVTLVKIVLTFEETGRVNSTIGRMVCQNLSRLLPK